MVKTEVLAINLSEKGISTENIEKIKNTLLKANTNNKIGNTNIAINDEEIVSLNNDLKK